MPTMRTVSWPSFTKRPPEFTMCQFDDHHIYIPFDKMQNVLFFSFHPDKSGWSIVLYFLLSSIVECVWCASPLHFVGEKFKRMHTCSSGHCSLRENRIRWDNQQQQNPLQACPIRTRVLCLFTRAHASSSS